MRLFASVLMFLVSSVCWATPITYSFEGYCTDIFSNIGALDPLSPLVRDDGAIITNGDARMTGQIVFDPTVTRTGAGGTGVGEVLHWSFTTQGLTYTLRDPGNTFHYLDFLSGSFRYSDEVADGGYGPDVVSLGFDFNGAPFSSGPADFPVSRFIGGTFSTAIDLAEVNDVVTMYGLGGEITSMRVTPVPGPSSVLITMSGLLLIGLKRFRAKRCQVYGLIKS